MQLRSLTKVFSALNQANVQYLVVGGLAVVAHGYMRTTEDLDLVIGLEPDNIKRGLAALESIGYQMGIPVTSQQFADPLMREKWRKTKGMLVLKLWSEEHRRTPIDIFVYEPFDMRAELNRAVWVELSEEVRVPIVSLSALLAMKRTASRPQDLADIHELQQANDQSAGQE